MIETKSHGSVLGASLLIAGCCIGAGMLGMPILSASAGFFPSLCMFTFAWAYMVITGLYLLEVNLWFKEDVSLISMAGATLGKWAQGATWFLFLYLFYSIMVAYVAASGSLTSGVLDNFQIFLPQWVGMFVFTLLFALLIYFGTGVVDHFNRFLMIGLIASYLALVLMGVRYIQPELLEFVNWKASFLAFPLMVISFGYHNMIPSLTAYLHHDSNRMVKTILIGTSITLLVYLAWQAVVLGIVTPESFQQSIDDGEIATSALKKVVNSPFVTFAAEYFSFFALVSSFLAVALSFVDFLSDGFGIVKDRKGSIFLLLMTLIPPLVFAMIYPTIFLKALNYGAIGAILLFGVLPTLMVWNGRGKDRKVIVPGGKIGIASVFILSLLIIVLGV